MLYFFSLPTNSAPCYRATVTPKFHFTYTALILKMIFITVAPKHPNQGPSVLGTVHHSEEIDLAQKAYVQSFLPALGILNVILKNK